MHVLSARGWKSDQGERRRIICKMRFNLPNQIYNRAAFGKTAHVREHNWMLLKPNERNIYLVNTDFGDVPGWAEGSLRCAERALYHFFDVARPQWLDARYHDPVIRRLNGGSVWVGRDAHLNTP